MGRIEPVEQISQAGLAVDRTHLETQVAETRRALISAEVGVVMGLLVGVGERWRVAELVTRYVGAAQYWSPATTARRETAARNVTGDRLGTVLVGRLNPTMLDAAVDRWRTAGASAAMVRAMQGVVRFAVSWAVEQRWLVADVLAGVGGTPGCPPRGQMPVSAVRAVATAAREDVRRAKERYVGCGGSSAVKLDLFRAEQRLLLVYLVADTGLRCGELAGLRSDDLLGRELWIERAVKRDLRGGLVVGPTKSHRHGRLTVSAATAQCWREHVRAWHGPPNARAAKCVAVQGQPTGRATHFNGHADRPVWPGEDLGELQ